MTVGILGGGQLGRMLALGGYPLGLRFRFLDLSPRAPPDSSPSCTAAITRTWMSSNTSPRG